MARRPVETVEQKLAALARLEAGDAGAQARVVEALRGEIGIVVAAAARLVAAWQLDAVAAELAPAFERLLELPLKRDPGCRGKIALVKALHALDRWDDRVFVAGLSHVQHEGPLGAGGRDDTAAELRGLCGIVHAQHGRADALDVLATLLADPEHRTRTGAARGLGDSGRLEATALLRFKLLIGDDEPDVLTACAESLLSLAREASTDFLVGLLAQHDDRAEVVALALGGARVAAALAPLTAWCVGAAPEQRHRVGYLAIALLRSDAGNAYLLDAVGGNARADALAAARALAKHGSMSAREIAESAMAIAAGICIYTNSSITIEEL
jgi:hypothetical protein